MGQCAIHPSRSASYLYCTVFPFIRMNYSFRLFSCRWEQSWRFISQHVFRSGWEVCTHFLPMEYRMMNCGTLAPPTRVIPHGCPVSTTNDMIGLTLLVVMLFEISEGVQLHRHWTILINSPVALGFLLAKAIQQCKIWPLLGEYILPNQSHKIDMDNHVPGFYLSWRRTVRKTGTVCWNDSIELEF